MPRTDYESLPWDKRPWVRLQHNGQPAEGEVRARWRENGEWWADVVYTVQVDGYPGTYRNGFRYEELEHVPEVE